MTYIAPTGRVSSKVAKMLEAQGLRVTQFLCTGRRGSLDDVYSWEAECQVTSGLTIFIGCFDTLTECARYGIGGISWNTREVSSLKPLGEPGDTLRRWGMAAQDDIDIRTEGGQVRFAQRYAERYKVSMEEALEHVRNRVEKQQCQRS